MSTFEKVGFLAENPSNIDIELERLFKKKTTLAKKLNEYSQTYQYNLHPQNNNKVELFTVTLFARSLSTYQAVLLLAQKGMEHQTNMLVRCLMEVVFRLKALAIDHAFIDMLKIDDNHRDYKRVQNFIDLKNMKQTKDNDYDRACKMRIGIRKEKKEINPDSIPELTIINIAKLAKMTDQYLIKYSHYSADIHCATGSLMSHFILDADGQINGLKNEPSTGSYENCIMHSMYLLLIVLESTNKIFNYDLDEKFEILCNEFKMIEI